MIIETTILLGFLRLIKGLTDAVNETVDADDKSSTHPANQDKGAIYRQNVDTWGHPSHII